MTDARMPTPKPTLMKVFDDPTPNGVINQRILVHVTKLLSRASLTEEEKLKVMNISVLIAKKLAAVWKHKLEYQRIQKELVEREMAKEPDPHLNRIEASQDLFLEFDEYLVQIKSTLDYLVHLPVPIFTRKKWNLRSFGDKGNDVINALRRNLPREQQRMVEGMIKYLFDKAKPWLKETIYARDKVNHFLDGGVPFEYFSVWRIEGPQGVRVPMWSKDQTIESFMDVSWHNLFVFVEDFITMIIYFKFSKGITLRHGLSEIDSPVSPWEFSTEAELDRETKGPGWSVL